MTGALPRPPAGDTAELARLHARVVPPRAFAPSPARRLDRLERRLAALVERLPDRSAPAPRARATEWLLDNTHLVSVALERVREGLPRGFHNRLPLLPASGRSRVRQLASWVVARGRGYVDPAGLVGVLVDYQTVTPLTIGELWALPSMLRWVLLELLAEAGFVLVPPAHGSDAGEDPASLPVSEAAAEGVAACIRSLRALDAYDWKRFFESVSLVERVLRKDPARIYARADFATRDRCRKTVEQVARRVGQDEVSVAETALELAAAAPAGDARLRHVAFYLVDEGRDVLEATAGDAGPAWRRALSRKAAPLAYFGAVAVATALALALLVAPFLAPLDPVAVLVGGVLGLIPASAVGISLVNWLATHLVKPRLLPKLDIEGRLPPELRTLVAVPALLSGEAEVEALLTQLELNFQANPLEGLSFALLTDLPDAAEEVLPSDAPLLERAVEGIDGLNREHGPQGPGGPFLLLHRPRRWNGRQGCWMGWERKRGKLVELNRLLTGGESELRVVAGDPARLRHVRYVVTLDADTFLPQGAAARLVGTAAHPLNRPVLDERGRVVAGYTVLQPRVETTPRSAGASPFARLFEGERGLDLYSHAVSDVYQDLFGSGIYAGKGIYDVAAFESSLAGWVPENAILSHDLFEGEHGRAGLVSDVAVYEDYPSHVLTYFNRLHRWVRGDWQLLPWLLPRVPLEGGGRGENPIRPLGRWKIFDNLRRSLLWPDVLLLLLAGWTFLPGPAGWWTAAALGVPAMPLLLDALGEAGIRVGRPSRSILLTRATRSLGRGAGRWAVAVVFLPYRALLDVDAVGRTLWRLFVSRRNLLEWRTAAHVAVGLAAATPRATWKAMAPGPVAAVGMGLLLAWLRPGSLAAAGPPLVLWAFSPVVAGALSRPRQVREERVTEEERRRLGALARRTWGFFERFLGPEHQWLPPDHFQERPQTGAVHRSSPTNIGLGALSVLAAWDLGYVPASTVGATLGNVLDAVEALERHRGHLFNWYDTRHRTVLHPRFVSTVDSGNMAAALMTLAQGCRTLVDEPFPRPRVEAEGLLDALEVVRESTRRLEQRAGTPMDLGPIKEWLDAAAGRIRSAGEDARAWARVLTEVEEEDVPILGALALDLVETVSRTGRVAAGAELRITLQHFRRQVQWHLSEMAALTPWLLPVEGRASPWTTLEADLPDHVSLSGLPDMVPGLLPGVPPEARRGLEQARQRAIHVHCELEEVARRADVLVEDMDFRFLYDRLQKVFCVGYDADTDRLTSSHYDLLASEARLASFVAIAKGDVPPEHWLHLGRPFARRGGRGVLLSWSGTLFEYLMPELLLRTAPPSLLDFADRAAVERHMAFGRRERVPWGVSESAYHHTDLEGTYQYRAFGVPDMAIRRDTGDRVVVAPYASILALRIRPRDVVRNLERIEALDGLGVYGFYEALDFSGSNGASTPPNVVRSWMAHHQGMSLLALANFLRDGVMVERFHADTRVQAAELLLHEGVPGRVAARPRAVPVDTSVPRAATPPPAVGWSPEADTALPQVHALSNGQWSTLVTDLGGGGARWSGLDLTRWRADPVDGSHGVWLYLQDLEEGTLWSATAAPTETDVDVEEVAFAPHRADFRRTLNGVTSRLTLFVAPTAPVEIRRLRLTNEGPVPRRVGVTSYGEVALAPHAQDRRHPAFAKLFLESAWRQDAGTLVFRRRPGMRGSDPAWIAHTVLCRPGELVGWETDRGAFLGRTGSPESPVGLRGGPRGLTRTEGATLDPVFSLGCEVELPPFGQTTLTFLTSAGRSEADALAAMEPLRSADRGEWALEQMAERARLELHTAGLHPGDAHLLQELLTALVHPYHPLRGRAVRHRTGRPRQPELWAQGISGDVPVLLLRVPSGEHLAEAEEVLRLHARLLRRRVLSDLVVLDETAGDYADPVRFWLQGAVGRHHGLEWVGRTGGVHHVAAGRLDDGSRDALEGAAALVLDTGEGSVGHQLQRLKEAPDPLPLFVPVAGPARGDVVPPPLPDTEELAFFNGLGGLSAGGREYVIRLDGRSATPAPWINVVANPGFGFTVSERGAGFTWCGNSGERRLSSWTNDPVLDRPGEAIYLRDEETADVWSPTPGPAPSGEPYEVRHGAGYTTFSHHGHGLAQHLEMFVAPDAPVKILRLRVTDLLQRPRRLTVTSFVEWVLGNHRDVTAPHVVTELAAPDAAVLARETFSSSYASTVAFHAASESLHGATGDRIEFLGGPGGMAFPPGLQRVGLAEAFGAGLDPCAALQVHVDLPPGGTRTLHFVLGQAEGREEAFALIRRYRSPDAAEEAWRGTRDFWEEFLGRVEVRTPEPALDALLNRWLPYQALACRLWGRSALYQSSGAYGFRDQLQDTLALLDREPELARQHLLEAARHQFVEGDVLHWWHPGSDEGVRTRCSDDLLWLPFVTAAYVAATGDEAVLQAPVPFLDAPPLGEEERERYQRFPSTADSAPLYVHCLRALERGSTRGDHGLPLMGTGDWNDGMDRVGEGGRGESVWLAWFLLACLRSFLPLARRAGDASAVAWMGEEARRLRDAAETAGWDGGWYRRAYYDDGTPLGTAGGEEAVIDSLTQSWAALSGEARPDRARQALDAVLEHLVREDERLVLLLTPPFDQTDKEPGYIKAYPPGVRENGGQYTHAAVWVAWALTTLGDGEAAGRLLRLLNPLLRSDTPERAAAYRVEPWVVAADVYGAPPHVGRGGWTWYTGSSGWLYRLGVEAVLGIRPVADGFRIEPCIPPEWPGYEAVLRRGESRYRVRVENPEGASSRVGEVWLDGTLRENATIPWLPGPHEVVVRLGEETGGTPVARPLQPAARRSPIPVEEEST